MSAIVARLRRQLAKILALAVLAAMFHISQLPTTPAAEAATIAAGYEFTPLTIAMPPDLPSQTIRPVNQDYHRIPAWISSVGAGVAMADLTGDGRANDLCLTDPRADVAVVTPAPGAERYRPFVLDPDPLPIDETMAPMGCVPGDYNGDGVMDLLVYYWGRTPIIFLGREPALREPAGLDAEVYRPVEMVPGVSIGGEYRGPQWNTNAIAVADFDGDGYADIFVGNFWPHGPVLDETVAGGVAMPDSLSYALNGGENYVYRWAGGSGGAEPTVEYQLAKNALPGESAHGWALGAATADLDGDLLPELYIAHDFGPDRLLHNRSRPGVIEFSEVIGVREPMMPRSKVLGRSSFKGMGVDFGDLTGDGQYDLFVSNITTSYGIQESNFAFLNSATDQQAVREELLAGRAPFRDRSAPLGVAWSGWGWDVKIADLNNNGVAEIVQATGFIQGRTDRWPQLQEMATTNDGLVSDPRFWPHIRAGDDIAGDQTLAFFARDSAGRYVDVSDRLGLAVPVPTRGIALGDATGDGRLDFAVARQWEAPIFYRNDSPEAGKFLGLRLYHDPAAEPAGAVRATDVGSPAVGAQVEVRTPDGRVLIGRVDGGSGHSGKRSQEVVIGLGDTAGPLEVTLRWRDRDGQVRQAQLELSPGWRTIHLGKYAKQVTR